MLTAGDGSDRVNKMNASNPPCGERRFEDPSKIFIVSFIFTTSKWMLNCYYYYCYYYYYYYYSVYVIELVLRILAVGPMEYFRKWWNRYCCYWYCYCCCYYYFIIVVIIVCIELISLSLLLVSFSCVLKYRLQCLLMILEASLLL